MGLSRGLSLLGASNLQIQSFAMDALYPVRYESSCALIQSSLGAFTMPRIDKSKYVPSASIVDVPHHFATIGEWLMREGT